MTSLRTPISLLIPVLISICATFAHGADAHSGHSSPHSHASEGTAPGQPGDAAKVTRTVRVSMSDSMRFDPAAIAVRKGETVRFIVSNKGALLHEMVLGAGPSFREHAELMKKQPRMAH